MASPRPPTHEKISNGARQGATPTSKMVPRDKKEEPHLMVLPPPTATTTMAPTRSSSPKMKTMESTLQDEGRSTQLYANMTMICPPRPRSSQCFRCTQDGHHLWECPNLHCDVCTSNKHMTWECNTPQAHKLYFAQLDAQFANMTLQDTIVFKEWCKEMDKMTTMKPTLQDGAREGQDKSDVDSSLALNNTIAPSNGVNMGGDGVEKVEHGMIPSTKEANGVENGEHGMIPSPMEAHGDDKIEPTPICLNDEMVPIPCEHESHLAHLSESDSELSDSHPICEIECFHLEDMSDTPSSMDDEFPIMDKMYMVHEDDAITPCLIEDEHGGHMEPTTSTTPTSNESDYKGTRKTRSTSIEHELTKRALESIIQELDDKYGGKRGCHGDPRTQGRCHGSMEEKEKEELDAPGGTSAPDGQNFRPTGTSAPDGRNFRPTGTSAQVLPLFRKCAKTPLDDTTRKSAVFGTRPEVGRNFRPPGPELPPRCRQDAVQRPGKRIQPEPPEDRNFRPPELPPLETGTSARTRFSTQNWQIQHVTYPFAPPTINSHVGSDLRLDLM
ncbi:hypothetical protein QYE76_022512 [Lolium multiflorum]|uniref:CCHC-type domain-containing protein n=1 Tax=Lolium multiflorum TaxID=4521 RepID=A0AAD8R8S8_LOLMU|nr:hypothetical protein QYE76_022512 [Lolium multiflorum]